MIVIQVRMFTSFMACFKSGAEAKAD